MFVNCFCSYSMAKTLKIIIKKRLWKIIFANGSSTVMVLSIFFNYFCAVPIYKRKKKIKIKSFKHCLPRALPAFLLPQVLAMPLWDARGEDATRWGSVVAGEGWKLINGFHGSATEMLMSHSTAPGVCDQGAGRCGCPQDVATMSLYAQVLPCPHVSSKWLSTGHCWRQAVGFETPKGVPCE